MGQFKEKRWIQPPFPVFLCLIWFCVAGLSVARAYACVDIPAYGLVKEYER
jgi:hypothetical protein